MPDIYTHYFIYDGGFRYFTGDAAVCYDAW